MASDLSLVAAVVVIADSVTLKLALSTSVICDHAHEIKQLALQGQQ
jgi:hypothetical protein